MQTYSIYIEYTNDTYDTITRQCASEHDAELQAVNYANEQDQEIYFIEANQVEEV
jgi:hypothetical protein